MEPIVLRLKSIDGWDIGKIHNGEMQYVDLLYRYGIMKGSLGLNNKVSFMPGQGVKRSEFAAISNRVYDFSSNEQFKAFHLARDYVTYKNTIPSSPLLLKNLIKMVSA